MGENMKRNTEISKVKSIIINGGTEENVDEQKVLSRKRKLYAELENEYCYCCDDDVESETESLSSPAASRTSGCSSKHDDDDDVAVKKRSPDLKKFDSKSERLETEVLKSGNGGVFSTETTPTTTTSELSGDSEEVLKMSSTSSVPEIPRRKNIPSEKMPSEAELEDFFSAAEKHDQKQFAEKYNYDIVKDVPLEGKYQWVRLRL